MKIKKVTVNNRKKAFEVQTALAVYLYPFSRLRLAPTAINVIESVFVDPELGHEGFTYRLSDGRDDSIVLDQILEYARDPDYLRKALLSRMAIYAQKEIRRLGVSKREVIRRMGTTPTQFYRLMDQTNTQKTVDQMLRLLAALDCSVDLIFKTAA